MIILTFNKSTEARPDPNQRIWVITTEALSFGYYQDSWMLWQPVASNYDGEVYPANIPFDQLQEKYPNDDIIVSYGGDSHMSCSLETFLNKRYLWMPVSSYSEVTDYLNETAI